MNNFVKISKQLNTQRVESANQRIAKSRTLTGTAKNPASGLEQAPTRRVSNNATAPKRNIGATAPVRKLSSGLAPAPTRKLVGTAPTRKIASGNVTAPAPTRKIDTAPTRKITSSVGKAPTRKLGDTPPTRKKSIRNNATKYATKKLIENAVDKAIDNNAKLINIKKSLLNSRTEKSLQSKIEAFEKQSDHVPSMGVFSRY